MTTPLIRSDFYDLLQDNIGLSRQEAVDIFEMVLDEMSEALANNEKVKISSFGSFHVHQKKQRISRNPKTGEKAMVSARKVVAFRPSQTLKSKLFPD